MTKALFFDVDGTLLHRGLGMPEVPAGVVAQLRRIRAAGNRVLVCSGRPRLFIGPELERVGFDGYVLANGGFLEIDGVAVYEERMGYEAARAAVDLLRELGHQYTVDTAHHVYLDPSFAELGAFFSQHQDAMTSDFDLDDALARAIKVECFPPDGQRDVIRRLVGERIGPSVFCGDNGTGMTFELYSPRLSKVTGVAKALEHFGIARKDSYAFGDGANDLGMISYCGCGVAMGNAVPEVRAAADLVCGRIDENGLETCLRELFP